jgi:hypothetical protein
VLLASPDEVPAPVPRALIVPEAPRSWREWTALALGLGAFAAALAVVASGPGHSVPGFWLLWAVMVAAGSGLLLHRASVLARHTAAGGTSLDRALWIAAEVAGVLAVAALLLAALL